MNEKKKQYWSLENSKRLIEKKVPTESDLEKFYEWRDLRSKRFKKASIISSIILLIMVLMEIFIVEFPGLIAISIFGLVDFFIIKEFKNSKRYVLEYCDYGTIIDKYEDDDRNDKDYYVIVEANNNKLKYQLTKMENSLFELHDKVVIFAIQNKDATFIAKKD